MSNEAPGEIPAGPLQAVAVIGGATAGAEVASRLAERGILVVVFEQNARPFGKIEDGLPRWHEKLRLKEYERITEKLGHPLVELLPSTGVGPDVDFVEISRDWGFAAVVLANGAWRDRPLPLRSDVDARAYVGRGLEYQNPFVIGFNHADDPDFEGRRPEILDGSAVIGGGLAAIDVAKICNLTVSVQALAERGIATDVVELEHVGIPNFLERHGLEWADLGLSGCTLYYRRRVADMPVMAMPEGADAVKRAKVEATREKLIAKVRAKYCVEVVPLAAPDDLIIEDERVVGLRLRRTVMAEGRLISTDETFEVATSQIISSIGSIPEPIPGIPMKGELFDFRDWNHGSLEGFEGSFAVGNVLTGKGNIAVSRRHAVQVSDEAIEAYLGVREGDEAGGDPSEGPLGVAGAAARLADGIAQHIAPIDPITDETLAAIRARVAARQAYVGFSGDLVEWLERIGQPC